MAPRYHYTSRLRLGRGGAGELMERLSHGSGPENTLAITRPPAAVDRLYADLRSAGLFRTAWRQDRNPSVGGSSWYLLARTGGRTRRVPGCVRRSQLSAKARIGQGNRIR